MLEIMINNNVEIHNNQKVNNDSNNYYKHTVCLIVKSNK